MKQKKSKTIKKLNITLRRRLTIAYFRVVLAMKLMVVLFFLLLFFTHYLDFIKHEIAQNLYEMTAELGFKLENVVIEGQDNTTQDEILSTLNADTGTPIFSINLQQIKSQLEKKPWVKQAAVKRRLPNTLYIAISEKEPIALWQLNQKIFLIDGEGTKIISSDSHKFSKLLHVVGIDANLYAANLIHELSNYPELARKIVSAVRYGQRRWNLNLQQNITVKMPELGFDRALKYLNELDKAGKLLDQNYKTIDLRDAGKYYIEKF